MHAFVYDVLGIENTNTEQDAGKLDGVVELLINMRKKARDDKDWGLSDQIRDQLMELGIQLKDGKDGTSFQIMN